MEAVDHLVELGQQARLIETTTKDRKARRLASQAVQCATAGIQCHNEGSLAAANLHGWNAADHLRNASRLHAASLDVGETPSSQVLGSAYLGNAQQHHQDYVDSVNEGMKNGR